MLLRTFLLGGRGRPPSKKLAQSVVHPVPTRSGHVTSLADEDRHRDVGGVRLTDAVRVAARVFRVLRRRLSLP